MIKKIDFLVSPFKNRFRRKNEGVNKLDDYISKRQRFVLASIILTVFLLLISLSPLRYRYVLSLVLGLLAYILFWFGLWEDISGIEWLTLFVLPVLFSITVSLWYFLLPIRWITRILVAIPFSIIIYFLLLTENIYNVAVTRTIQLLRVARTVGSFIVIMTSFLFFWTLLSFDLNYFFNFLLVLIFTFLLLFTYFWNFKLTEKVDPEVFLFASVFSLVIAEMAYVLSFWPVTSIMETLFLSTILYSFLGFGENYFLGKPMGRLLITYGLGIISVLILVFISTSWG